MTATISYGSVMAVQAMYHDMKLEEQVGNSLFAVICIPDHGIHGVLGFETADEAFSAATAQAADIVASGLRIPVLREITLAGVPPLLNASENNLAVVGQLA